MEIAAGNAQEFFKSEFESLNLRDIRLNKRALEIGKAMQENPTTCIRRLYDKPNQSRQAYDFFSNKKVSMDALLEPHYKQTVKRIKASNSEYVLALQDSMNLNYTSHKAKKDAIGRIGKSGNTIQKGFIQHSTLCVSEDNESLGILDCNLFHHDEYNTDVHRIKRSVTEKESGRWINALKMMRKRLGNCDKKIITVADREGDFFEFLFALVDKKEDFVIRLKNNRFTGEKHRDRGDKVKDIVCLKPILKEAHTITLQNVKTRRYEKIKLNYQKMAITIPVPNKSSTEKNIGDYYPITINVVRAFNDNHEWFLYTSLPIETFEDIKKITDIYRKRWHIEDFHKVLKTGYQVEELQLHSSEESIKSLIAMAIISSVRLYWLIFTGRTNENIKANKLFSEFEWKSLYVYFKKPIPKEPPPIKEVMTMIAQLGGYKITKKSFPPGIKTIWHGMQKFTPISKMYKQMLLTCVT